MEIKVSIISSSFNEEENIPVLIETFRKFNVEQKNAYELIIVDDGSTDSTYKLSCDMSKDDEYITVKKHRKNYGKTAGIITGVESAKGEIIVIYDTDMQYDMFELPRLVSRIADDGFDICTGWKQGHYKKAFVSNVYNAMSRRIFKLPIHDQNGLKVLRKEIFSNIHLRTEWHRYIVSLAADKGYTVCEEKVLLYPRKHGKSKYDNPFRVFTGIFDMMTVKFLISFLKKPMVFFGGSGAFLIVMGLLAGIAALVLRIFFNLGFRPLLYLVMLLILSGLVLFTMGFLAEIISIIYEQMEQLKSKRKGL